MRGRARSAGDQTTACTVPAVSRPAATSRGCVVVVVVVVFCDGAPPPLPFGACCVGVGCGVGFRRPRFQLGRLLGGVARRRRCRRRHRRRLAVSRRRAPAEHLERDRPQRLAVGFGAHRVEAVERRVEVRHHRVLRVLRDRIADDAHLERPLLRHNLHFRRRRRRAADGAHRQLRAAARAALRLLLRRLRRRRPRPRRPRARSLLHARERRLAAAAAAVRVDLGGDLPSAASCRATASPARGAPRSGPRRRPRPAARAPTAGAPPSRRGRPPRRSRTPAGARR